MVLKFDWIQNLGIGGWGDLKIAFLDTSQNNSVRIAVTLASQTMKHRLRKVKRFAHDMAAGK